MSDPTPSPIVCGTDFSEPAQAAANIAAIFARRREVPLLLVHGVDERGEIPMGLWPNLIEPARPKLRLEAERLRKLGAAVEEKVAGGVPDDGVLRVAEAADASLIVLASSGMGALGRWMLGSISERIAESAWVPTLVVRDAVRLEAWASGNRPLRVLVGADFESTSAAALRWAAGLHTIGPCEITVGYIDQQAAARAEAALHSPPDTPRAPEMQEMLTHDLHERTAQFFGEQEVNVRVLPVSGSVDTHLLELAGEAVADLIVIGTHQWHGLSRLRHHSVSRRVLRHAQVSVACVPSHSTVHGPSLRIPNVRRVLVATDLSVHGSNAVPYAFSILGSGGTVHLLHVAAPGEAHPPHLASLRALIPAEAPARQIRAEVEVIESRDAAVAICEAADRHDADVICIGAHGASGLAGAVMGAVAHTLVDRSTRPVLVVHPPAS